MGRWKKPEPVTEQGICVVCRKRPQMSKGDGRFRAECQPCHREIYQIKSVREHRKYVEDKCDRCGFEPENICQLDVHHVDGNHQNNDPENLRTLCANCHRLYTHGICS